MLNQVQLVGRPTKELEVKIINENAVVCNFTLAVNRSYKNKDGEYEADFVQCQAWGKRAEFLGSYVQKGQLISVVGQIQTRSWEDEEKQKHYVTEVNVNQVESLERKEAAPSFENEVAVKEAWNAEWAEKSVGLDATAKASLKKKLRQKYEPLIEALKPKTFNVSEDDLPF